MAAELGVMSGAGERADRLFAWIDIPPGDAKKLGAESVQDLADTGQAKAAALCKRLECAISVIVHTSERGAHVSAECNGLICASANNNNVIVGFCGVARRVLGEVGVVIVEQGQTVGTEQQISETAAGGD